VYVLSPSEYNELKIIDLTYFSPVLSAIITIIRAIINNIDNDDYGFFFFFYYYFKKKKKEEEKETRLKS
jgi:hypothetical protein